MEGRCTAVRRPLRTARGSTDGCCRGGVGRGSIGGSGKQARGVAQFIPVTAREHGLIVTDPKSDDPEKDQRLDPVRSIGAAARFYQKLLKRADGNVEAAHIMYNYGPGAYRTWLSNPSKKLPTETRNHLARLRAVRRYIEENP